jgi:phytoene dehydrogenase-like protein
VSTPPATTGGPDPREAVVVGAGLAGLVAALRLAEAGVPVQLYEAAPRAGGKAGSDPWTDGVTERLSDHGYHVFPAWYHNTWTLLDELGAAPRYRRRRHFWRVHRARLSRLERDGGPLWRSRRLAVISPRSLLTALDLVAKDEAALATTSLECFIRTRWYNDDETGHELRDIAMKGLGNPAHLVSTITFRANMRLLLKTVFRPNWTAAAGPLQTELIEPLLTKLKDEGVEPELGVALTGIEATGAGPGFTITALRLADGRTIDARDRPVVLAIPHQQLAALLRPHQDRLPPALGALEELTSRPMVALDLHLKRPVRGLPKHGHVILDGSRFHLSLLDIRRVWDPHHLPPGAEDQPVWQVIAAHLDGRQPDVALRDEIVDDLLGFFPFLSRDDLGEPVFHPNDEAPLFMNTVGSDAHRPVSTEVHGRNLLVAGDWCRTPIHLACMEGALVSGAQAAATVLGGEADLKLPPPEASVGARVACWILAPILWLLSRPAHALHLLRRRLRDPDRPPVRG